VDIGIATVAYVRRVGYVCAVAF